MILLAGIRRAEIIGTEPRTNTVPVADVIDAWRASEEGPCVRCGARTCIYGPRGNPVCVDCRPPKPGPRSSRGRHPASPAAAQPDRQTWPNPTYLGVWLLREALTWCFEGFGDGGDSW